jgi:hypothetical protein
MSQEATASPDAPLSPTRPQMRVRVSSANFRAGWALILPPILAVVGSIAAGMYLADVLQSRVAMALPVVVLLACAAFLFSSAWMTVDDAGIEIAWLGKRRVTPRASIEDAVVFDFMTRNLQRFDSTDPNRAETGVTTRNAARCVGVELRCRGGEVLRILMGSDDDAREKAQQVAQRVRETFLSQS